MKSHKINELPMVMTMRLIQMMLVITINTMMTMVSIMMADDDYDDDKI